MSGIDVRKLGLVLSRLSSEHDGEALNAARLACRMLDAAGLRPEHLSPNPATAPRHDGDLAQRYTRLAADNLSLLRRINTLETQLQRAERNARHWRMEAQASAQHAERREAKRARARDDFDDESEEKPAADPLGGSYSIWDFLECGMYLTAWERDFLQNLQSWDGDLTPKQAAVWQRLAKRREKHRQEVER